MNPGFSLGPITFYYYGLILAVAILVAYVYARKRAAKHGVPVGLIDSSLLFVTALGVIGARLYYVAFSWSQFSDNPREILNIQGGGLAIHGALIGGAVGLVLVWLWYRRRAQTLRFSSLLDVFAPVLPLAQAIGRVANYVNQEAFGNPTTLPWGIYISPERRPAQFQSAEHFHPTFAYEAFWNLFGLGLVLLVERWITKRSKIEGKNVATSALTKKPNGVLFAVYLGWYSLGRIWIEALRTDALLVGSAKIAQIVSLGALLGSAAFIWYRLAQWRSSRGTTKS